jgi:outer membrane receptor protein involved in Fe transport
MQGWRPREGSEPNPESGSHDDRHESLYRAYLYWTPNSEWALSGEFLVDFYETDSGEGDVTIPNHVKTWSTPISASYFSPLGIFAGTSMEYVHQNVSRNPDSTVPRGHDGFVVFDAVAGYRFPERYGLISFEVRNIFDSDIRYQDDSFRSRVARLTSPEKPTVSPFDPGRTFVGRLTLNF